MPAKWQQYSTGPAARFEIVEVAEDGTETPYDLTGCTVTMRFAKKGEPASWERECQIDEPATAGKCHLDWAAGDLDVSGEFEAELLITKADGTIEVAPPHEVEIARSIPPVPT